MTIQKYLELCKLTCFMATSSFARLDRKESLWHAVIVRQLPYSHYLLLLLLILSPRTLMCEIISCLTVTYVINTLLSYNEVLLWSCYYTKSFFLNQSCSCSDLQCGGMPILWHQHQQGLSAARPSEWWDARVRRTGATPTGRTQPRYQPSSSSHCRVRTNQ